MKSLFKRNHIFRRIKTCNGLVSSFSTVNSNIDNNIPKSTTDFGFKEVPVQEKEYLVKEIFSKVAEKYDVMNDVMSFGAHRIWKDELVSMINLKSAARVNPEVIPRHLDVAGGTGDVSFRVIDEMIKNYPAQNLSFADDVKECERQVVVCDINAEVIYLTY